MCKALQDMRDEAIAIGELKTLYELTDDGAITMQYAAGKANMSLDEFKSNMDKYFASLK